MKLKRIIALIPIIGAPILALYVLLSKRDLWLPGPKWFGLILAFLIAAVVTGAFLVAGMYFTGLWG